MNRYDLIRYGGRACGAALAVLVARGRVGPLALVAVALAGWVVGGLVGDRYATRSGLASAIPATIN